MHPVSQSGNSCKCLEMSDNLKEKCAPWQARMTHRTARWDILSHTFKSDFVSHCHICVAHSIEEN
jgi:hypothetical protein